MTALDRLMDAIRPIAVDLFNDIALMDPEYQTKALNLLDAIEEFDRYCDLRTEMCLVASSNTNGKFYCTRQPNHSGPCAARLASYT